MNVLEMFKEWLTVEKGVELVPDTVDASPDKYVATVPGEDGFSVKLVVDAVKAIMLITRNDGIVHLYIMEKDANLDEYKCFINVANIWLEMNEFNYKLLLVFSEVGRLPRLLGNVKSVNLKEIDGGKFIALVEKLGYKTGAVEYKEVEVETKDVDCYKDGKVANLSISYKLDAD